MRLIDVDAAKKAVHEELDECLVWDESGEHTANVIEEILESLPTIDAVPVIRCKDCKWYDMTDSSGTVEPIGYRCKKVNRLWREPDDFCKGAERKEE